PKLERIIVRALGKQREARHQSAAEMRADLERIGAPGFFREVIRLLQRHRRIAAALLAAALVLAVIVTVSTRVREEALAVLPFVTTESDPSAKAGAEGIADGVATRLAQFSPRPTRLFRRTLTVIPYRDVIAHHVGNTDEARRELGANRVVEGSI